MGFEVSSASTLAACGGDTVKLFDLTVDSGDPCLLSYSPTPGKPVHSVKWNHTNLVVASAGNDNKISLWHKNGQSIGVMPPPGSKIGNDNEEILSINFSNKSSRYLCSGGSGHVVKIWDLQRKLCIKWLSGHSGTITGVMYNCKDEHLASVSTKGDIIIHNLASGAQTAELRDPNAQILRVLDYSRVSRHLMSTAGDDGSIHLWDTTGRSPKVSWLKQHSAPTSGVCFSPSSDKIIASVGFDKKLYTFDSGSRRPTSCTPYEAPFSSLAFNDDGNILAAGTSSGRIVFYDVRGKPQPFTVLRAYSSSEAVVGISWQRAKPVFVNEKNCSAETALLEAISEDSVLMPDPLPSVSVSSLSSTSVPPSFRSSLSASTSTLISSTSSLSIEEATPNRNRLLTVGTLPKLHAPRPTVNMKDDMDVFSPLVDVQPITPSLDNWWGNHDEARKEKAHIDKKSSLFASSSKRFVLPEGNNDPHPISDWRSSSTSRQDDTISTSSAATTTSSKNELSFSPPPPENWDANALVDKLVTHRQRSSLSRFMPSASLSSTFAGLQDSSLSTSHLKNSLTDSGIGSFNIQNKVSFDDSSSATFSEASSHHSNSLLLTSGARTLPSSANFDWPGGSALAKKLTYAERISTNSSFSEGMASVISSPKSKKTGIETREELMNSILSRQDTSTASGVQSFSASNVGLPQSSRILGQTSDQLGSTFSLQLIQRLLEETLGSAQKAIHEDVRNLHVDMVRQVHMLETEMLGFQNGVLDRLEEVVKEVQSLRRENQQLRQLLGLDARTE